mmetsp:Transcript_21484/g.61355  ORF Transcript_21484/g.61355 Transcript_21484/m.61355 type:complete len:397 (+) Transcript_21484:126-1316(+)|eukprot:CAMPEP_0119562850 /NCGR_PEP_ID=MMETSP1352-20130426/21741_1 /TAXON_ID=265584 /ORGANISM="Stauroneis constricta, Strain CCMP1120" /LENGTH=396 /DNA_ID=CAMNT_0007611345 /DNA_START=103 /DNA_END=1293 /DNA_ORIENTATION=+
MMPLDTKSTPLIWQGDRPRPPMPPLSSEASSSGTTASRNGGKPPMTPKSSSSAPSASSSASPHSGRRIQATYKITPASQQQDEPESALSVFLKTLAHDRTVTFLDDNHKSQVPTPPQSPRGLSLQERTMMPLARHRHILTPPRRQTSKRLLCIEDDDESLVRKEASRRRAPSPPVHAPPLHFSPAAASHDSSSSVGVVAATWSRTPSARGTATSQLSPARLAKRSVRSMRSISSRSSRSRTPSPSKVVTTLPLLPVPAPSPPLHRDSRWSPDSSLNWSSSSLDASFLFDDDDDDDNRAYDSDPQSSVIRMESPASRSYSRSLKGSKTANNDKNITQQHRHLLPPMRQFNPNSPSMNLMTNRKTIPTTNEIIHQAMGIMNISTTAIKSSSPKNTERR